MATSIISLKLLINKKTRKVLFAEASNDFVDLLFSILRLPIGIAARLIPFEEMGGCLSKIYRSVVDLDAKYLTTAYEDKYSLLHPVPISHDTNYFLSLDLAAHDHDSSRETFYTCANNHRYISNVPRTVCPLCPDGTEMETVTEFIRDVHPKASMFVGGYVKCGRYMVTDDLTVTPLLPMSNDFLRQMFDVGDIDDLEEKEVKCGKKEGLALLRASFESETVLTDVFLGKRIKTNKRA